MPDLWSKINLDLITLRSMGSVKQKLRIYKHFVSLAHNQSGTRPISMSIRAPEFLQGLDEDDSLFSALSFKFSDRWAEFSIDINLLILVQTRWGVNLRLPAVKSIALLDKSSNHTAYFVPDNMTQLTHLKLSSCSAPVAQLFCMPWSQITHLEAHCIHINDLGAVLRQMSTLTHTHLTLVGLGGNDVPALQAMYLPHLRDLTLSCHSQAHICALANSLTTPILSRFRVVVFTAFDAPKVPLLGQALRAFLHRSSPPITHLGLQGISLEGMKDMLEGLPIVESLELGNLYDSNAIMNHLVWSSQPDGSHDSNITNILPNLQMLTVRKADLSAILPGIIQMICSRHKGHVTVAGLGDHQRPARLHTVHFWSVYSMSSESLVQLRQLGIAIECMEPDIHHLNILPFWSP